MAPAWLELLPMRILLETTELRFLLGSGQLYMDCHLSQRP